jgi:hypothetical protein
LVFKNYWHFDVLYQDKVVDKHGTMRKYKYLNNHNAHKRDVAYEEDDIKTKYVFQQSSLDIRYLVCDTVDEFYAYYSRKGPCSRMFNEVINDNFSLQKFKLDIDGRIGDTEMQYVLKTIRKILRRLTKRRPEMLVYDISTSHHVVVDGLCFSSGSCEMLANAVSEKLSRKYPMVSSLIDTCVYKKVQMFRIEGSTKYGQRRWKRLNGGELSALETFKKGVISYVDECLCIDSDDVVDVMLDIGVYRPTEHVHKKDNVSTPSIPKEFVVRKKMDDLVVLDRIAPSFCDVCQRVHESENAYMVGRMFFCRRSMGN